jgi:dipeptidyl aminopeptidase/acylaminoacyl peptidase
MTFLICGVVSAFLGTQSIFFCPYAEIADRFSSEDIVRISQNIAESITPYPVSLLALMQKEYIGDDLVFEQILETNEIYTRYRISYSANGLSLSGIMNIPKGEGPFPLLVLNHGYIDPTVYTNGRGLKREQDYFARNGFAVIHPDYRNHVFSDKDPENTLRFRLGYTEDVIGAVLAVQNSTLPELASVDSFSVGMLGHSMGGGITQNVLVVRPDLIQAAVLYAPVSSNATENLNQYFLKNPARSKTAEEIFMRHGSPEENPNFWDGISPQMYFERVQVPVQIFIGTRDESTPPEWSEKIHQQLQELGKDTELIIFEGEKHEFIHKWRDFMKKSGAFFSEHLRKSD